MAAMLLWPTSGPDPRSPDEQKQIRPQAGRGSCTGKNDTRPVVSSSARGSAVLVNLYRKRSKAAGGQARFTACDRLGDRDQTALLPATTPSSPHEHRCVSPLGLVASGIHDLASVTSSKSNLQDCHTSNKNHCRHYLCA